MHTEKRLSDSQLLEVIALYKNAIAIYTTEDIIIEMANDAMLAFWDRDKSIIGMPLAEAVPELKSQPFIGILQNVLRTGIDDIGKAVKADIEVDGTLQSFYFDYEYLAIRDASGVPYCILHTAEDVTEKVLGRQAIETAKEQKEALEREQILNEELAATNEELCSTNEQLGRARESLYSLNGELEERVEKRTRDLSESEARFRSMAEGSDILIAVGDETGNVTYFSRAWVKLTGRSMEELLESGWADLVHPEDRGRYVNIYLTALKEKAPFTCELRILNKEGNYRWLLVKGPPRFRPDGSFAGYISSCLDITELKEEEQRKDDFISIASHELRTPLTSLKASLQLLERLKGDSSRKLLPALIEQSNKSMDKIMALVEDLLNFTRTAEGQLHLNKKTFVVAEMLEGCCNHVRVVGKYQLVIEGNKGLEIFADEHRIDQVIVNLVNNAVKYAPESKVIYLGVEKIDNMAHIYVKDSGPGIPADKIPHLFKRYYRADYEGSKYTGLGLGLYICAEIVQRHGGNIGVDSEPGVGSKFWFNLPVH